MNGRRWRQWLRWGVIVGGLLPLVWLVAAYLADALTFNPVQAATQRTGDYAQTFLWLSLACTPLSGLTGWKFPLSVRRSLGLFAFGYAALHALIFVGWDYGFDWPQVLPLFGQKNYLIAGLSALGLLTGLAVTSFGKWARRHTKAWTLVHRLVYLATVLVVVHYFMVTDGDITRLSGDIWKPLAYAVVLVLLLVLRVPGWMKGGRGRRHKA